MYLAGRTQNIWIQKLTGNLLEEESGKISSDTIDKTWPLADLFSSSLIGWFSHENGSVRVHLRVVQTPWWMDA